MQEVIKNIINKLEKRAEEHDFEGNRFAERKYWEDYCGEKNKMQGLNEAIEIVKQAAADCNNGWIPCSERLPNKEEFKKAYCRNKYGAEFIVMIEGADRSTTLYLTSNGLWVDDCRNLHEVIAWQPLPLPYTKGE